MGRLRKTQMAEKPSRIHIISSPCQTQLDCTSTQHSLKMNKGIVASEDAVMK